ncbi:LacI family DNA-binding transcriptional regulator [Anaerocolumna jejuensis]|uniref:LacI family DNA-binding transcriptional regulator n=1 Tax=Anaerocolumna jejuensis TaxID=259063 RepID=UPI003F7C26EB
MAKTVKLEDIAKKLGVSTVSVSKALSDQKGVSENMREKIKHLADEMGYVKSISTEKHNKKKILLSVL